MNGAGRWDATTCKGRAARSGAPSVRRLSTNLIFLELFLSFLNATDISIARPLMDSRVLQRLAPPAVTALVAFLAFTSQYLFGNIEPGPLRKGDAYIFNNLVACLLICYWRACFTDPGRISKDWYEKISPESSDRQYSQRQRWCRKCNSFKPPRAHHCKTCKRYVSVLM